MKRITLGYRALFLAVPIVMALSISTSFGNPKDKSKKVVKGLEGIRDSSRILYTTYFYTANEAIVHGYEKNTKAKIISLEKGGKVIWEGEVGQGETVFVPTGPGVFGFLTEKKASILVGTPSSCTAVGYFVKNQEGSFRSKLFYTQLPSSISMADARVLIWAWEDTKLEVTDRTTGSVLYKGDQKKGSFYEITSKELGKMGNHVLEINASQNAVSLQVYYDEGFTVPAEDGRASGKLFYTYVGEITTGENDLILSSYDVPAKITVSDILTGKTIFSGILKKEDLKAITLAKRYVKIQSDVEISVTVSAYQHYQGLYAEHHFSMGIEGTGIENKFLTTSPSELWIFSYFDKNQITVLDKSTGKEIFSGALQAGQVQSLTPGFGYYEVNSNKGISVLGGASACGGEYSPAAGLFSMDEELLEVFKEIRKERETKAPKNNFNDEYLNAPLSTEEIGKAQRALQKKTKRKKKLSAPEIQERLEKLKSH